ncbi:hypothetical protein HNP99_001621 [Flavobacterium sp. 28A]|uniref:hypothetical protein n=1 Tax=Flavobacterium sp. 28A TaxID=2735895 RepID=UPI001570CEA9|nr:hypothetical protein [Flavobacterium sp. 28A]NRT15274.1 hypothetical protein [Flavobacterium sp. 28A]
MTSLQLNKVDKILKEYGINFNKSDLIDIAQNQDTSIIPAIKILSMIGLKEDLGHQILIDKLNQFYKYWLSTFLKNEIYLDIYDSEGCINLKEMYEFISDIFDGLK